MKTGTSPLCHSSIHRFRLPPGPNPVIRAISTGCFHRCFACPKAGLCCRLVAAIWFRPVVCLSVSHSCCVAATAVASAVGRSQPFTLAFCWGRLHPLLPIAAGGSVLKSGIGQPANNMSFKSWHSLRSHHSDAPTTRSAANGFAILSQPPAPQVRRLTKCYVHFRRFCSRQYHNLAFV